MARTNAATALATEDVLVDAPKPTAEDLANLAEAAKAPVPRDVMDALQASMEGHAAQVKAKQSASRKANGTATTKPTAAKPTTKAPAKKATAKPAAKAKTPKAPIERVPAAEVIALCDELKITRSQLAAAVGKSPSLVSEWVGKGRGHLVARSDWKAIEAAARKFAKGLK